MNLNNKSIVNSFLNNNWVFRGALQRIFMSQSSCIFGLEWWEVVVRIPTTLFSGMECSECSEDSPGNAQSLHRWCLIQRAWDAKSMLHIDRIIIPSYQQRRTGLALSSLGASSRELLADQHHGITAHSWWEISQCHGRLHKRAWITSRRCTWHLTNTYKDMKSKNNVGSKKTDEFHIITISISPYFGPPLFPDSSFVTEIL